MKIEMQKHNSEKEKTDSEKIPLYWIDRRKDYSLRNVTLALTKMEKIVLKKINL